MKQILFSPIVLKFILFIWIVAIPLKNSFYQISTALLILYFVINVVVRKKAALVNEIFFQNKNLFLAFGCIILSMSISNFFGIEVPKKWHIEFSFIYRYGIVFFALSYFYINKYFTLKFLIYTILISISLQALDGLFQHFYEIDFIKGQKAPEGIWLTGGVFYYNPFGMIMAIGASVALTLLSKANTFALKNLQILFLIIFTILCSYTLIYSMSRASWVSFCAFLFTFIILNYKTFSLKKALLILSLIILTLIIVFNDQSVLHRFSQLIQGDSSHRFEIWSKSFTVFLEAPFFGYGLNSFRTLIFQEHSATHNSILEILLYLGIVGLAIYTYMVYLIAKKILTSTQYIYMPHFIFFLVISQFDNSVTSSKIFLSILTIFAFIIFHGKSNQIQK